MQFIIKFHIPFGDEDTNGSSDRRWQGSDQQFNNYLRRPSDGLADGIRWSCRPESSTDLHDEELMEGDNRFGKRE